MPRFPETSHVFAQSERAQQRARASEKFDKPELPIFCDDKGLLSPEHAVQLAKAKKVVILGYQTVMGESPRSAHWANLQQGLTPNTIIHAAVKLAILEDGRKIALRVNCDSAFSSFGTEQIAEVADAQLPDCVIKPVPRNEIATFEAVPIMFLLD